MNSTFISNTTRINSIALAFISLLSAHCSSCSSDHGSQQQHHYHDAGLSSGGGNTAGEDAGSGGSGGGAGGAAQGGNGGGNAIGLPDLPAASMISSATFTAAGACSMCHANNNGPAMKDAAGRDVSPLSLWRTSMMALSGRDPYFFAALSHEIEDNPGAKAVIETTCTRCHAPEASVELAAQNTHITLDELIEDTSKTSVLGREGVGCTLCHQIKPDNLGSPSSFTGHYEIGMQREIYGPHQNPFANPMKMNVNYTPTYADHMQQSALCATCHTVITRSLDAKGNASGPEVMEQVPYFEWQNSQYAMGPSPKSCQSCHMPTVDQDGNPITTKISNMPPFLNPRSPFGRHTLAGGNVYMLELLSENTPWLNAGLSPSDLKDSAAAVLANLQTAASLELVSASRNGADLIVDLRVKNNTGHKFPTAYPSRRAWLHVTVSDANNTIVFESGRFDSMGSLIDSKGNRIDGEKMILPHQKEIASGDMVQVYEGVMKDETGGPTHILLRATGFAKDNRILPAGYSMAHPNASKTNPIGVSGDLNFSTDGSDTTRYRIVNAPAGMLNIKAELLFQTVTPIAFDILSSAKTPAANHFIAMGKKKPPIPSLVSSLDATVP